MATDKGESSKQAKRRSDRLNLAAIAIAQQHGNEDLRMSKRGSNPSPSQPNSTAQRIPSPPSAPSNRGSDDSIEVEEQPTKKKRGPTKMRTLGLFLNERVEVEFNDRDQPIGLNSEKLSSFLGVLARDIVPISIDTWHKVDNKMKEDLWTCVQGRFKVDDTYKKLFTQVMGARWKDYKSKVVTTLRDASKRPNRESTYARLKPDNIDTPQEWNDFIRKKLSKEFQVISEKMQAIRGMNQAPHTMGRKGYARLENEMKKATPMPSAVQRDDVWIQAHTKKNGEVPTAFVAECVSKIQDFQSSQTSSEAPPIGQDALSHTFGPERNGRVRAMGPGITPSQVGMRMTNSKQVQRLQQHVGDLTHQIGDLTHQLGDLKNLMYQHLKPNSGANINIPSPGSQNMPSPASRVNSDDQNIPSPLSRVNEIHTTPSPRSSNASSKIGGRIQSGTECKLLNWQRVVVADATIASTDPNILVHHIPLGKDCWKVWVKVSLVDEAPLFKPNTELKVMADAQGSTIAWPKDYITLDGQG